MVAIGSGCSNSLRRSLFIFPSRLWSCLMYQPLREPAWTFGILTPDAPSLLSGQCPLPSPGVQVPVSGATCRYLPATNSTTIRIALVRGMASRARDVCSSLLLPSNFGAGVAVHSALVPARSPFRWARPDGEIRLRSQPSRASPEAKRGNCGSGS